MKAAVALGADSESEGEHLQHGSRHEHSGSVLAERQSGNAGTAAAGQTTLADAEHLDIGTPDSLQHSLNKPGDHGHASSTRTVVIPDTESADG
jgi:hypothetical protein